MTAGHKVGAHTLYVAFDTSATSLDVVSVPEGPTIWWIQVPLNSGVSAWVSPWFMDFSMAQSRKAAASNKTDLSNTSETPSFARTLNPKS